MKMNMPAKNAAPVNTQESPKTAMSALWRPALVQAFAGGQHERARGDHRRIAERHGRIDQLGAVADRLDLQRVFARGRECFANSKSIICEITSRCLLQC